MKLNYSFQFTAQIFGAYSEAIKISFLLINSGIFTHDMETVNNGMKYANLQNKKSYLLLHMKFVIILQSNSSANSCKSKNRFH